MRRVEKGWAGTRAHVIYYFAAMACGGLLNGGLLMACGRADHERGRSGEGEGEGLSCVLVVSAVLLLELGRELEGRECSSLRLLEAKQHPVNLQLKHKQHTMTVRERDGLSAPVLPNTLCLATSSLAHTHYQTLVTPRQMHAMRQKRKHIRKRQRCRRRRRRRQRRRASDG